MSETLTLEQVAEMKGVSLSTVRRSVRSGLLPAIRESSHRAWLVTAEAAHAWNGLATSEGTRICPRRAQAIVDLLRDYTNRGTDDITLALPARKQREARAEQEAPRRILATEICPHCGGPATKQTFILRRPGEPPVERTQIVCTTRKNRRRGQGRSPAPDGCPVVCEDRPYVEPKGPREKSLPSPPPTPPKKVERGLPVAPPSQPAFAWKTPSRAGRPKVIQCGECGQDVEVRNDGPVPRWCSAVCRMAGNRREKAGTEPFRFCKCGCGDRLSGRGKFASRRCYLIVNPSAAPPKPPKTQKEKPMPKKETPKYTEEQRRHAARLLVDDTPVKLIGEALGIPWQTIIQWRKNRHLECLLDTDETFVLVPERLTQLRELRELSQGDLAKAARFDFHASVISSWERRVREPAPPHVVALAKALKVDLGVLTGTLPIPDSGEEDHDLEKELKQSRERESELTAQLSSLRQARDASLEAGQEQVRELEAMEQLERENWELEKTVHQLREALEVEANNSQALTEENLRLRGELELYPRGRLERVKQSLLAIPPGAREKVISLVNLEAELRQQIEGAA